MYHNRSVSDGVFRYDHGVALLVPLRRLVLHVGDGDRKFHWAAPVAAVCGHNFSGDVGPLLDTENQSTGVYAKVRLTGS